jgi:short-subunit dehydrogenase
MSSGETVLITGASSGIGEALAWVFAEHGHDLVLVARSADKLEALADALAAEFGVAVSVRPADLSVAGSAAKLHGALRREGQSVDILVNNAGILEHGAFADLEPAAHQRMIQLNVAGFTELLAHFLPDMVANSSGRVLNVASVAAFMPVPSMATYAATKAYILSLSEALSEELRGSGVTVTALCPGFTATHMVEEVQAENEALRRVPRMMISDVEDVAREAFRECLKGTPIVIPGSLNLATALSTRATPKWLLRRLTGLLGRSTL